MKSAKKLAKRHGAVCLRLPGWDGEDFCVRARRPSLYNLAASGLVPNPLLGAVQSLFAADDGALEDLPLERQAQALLAIARYALVEPSYEELTAAGLALTDEQLLALYVFAMGGAAALEPFRRYLDGDAVRGGAGVLPPALPDAAAEG